MVKDEIDKAIKEANEDRRNRRSGASVSTQLAGRFGTFSDKAKAKFVSDDGMVKISGPSLKAVRKELKGQKETNNLFAKSVKNSTEDRRRLKSRKGKKDKK